jgi:hypothetical protein
MNNIEGNFVQKITVSIDTTKQLDYLYPDFYRSRIVVDTEEGSRVFAVYIVHKEDLGHLRALMSNAMHCLQHITARSMRGEACSDKGWYGRFRHNNEEVNCFDEASIEETVSAHSHIDNNQTIHVEIFPIGKIECSELVSIRYSIRIINQKGGVIEITTGINCEIADIIRQFNRILTL